MYMYKGIYAHICIARERSQNFISKIKKWFNDIYKIYSVFISNTAYKNIWIDICTYVLLFTIVIYYFIYINISA